MTIQSRSSEKYFFTIEVNKIGGVNLVGENIIFSHLNKILHNPLMQVLLFGLYIEKNEIEKKEKREIWP